MATKQYLDMAGLQTLVNQIKAEDLKDRQHADAIVGSLVKGTTTYDDMRSYVDAQVVSAGNTITYGDGTSTSKTVGGLTAGTSISGWTIEEVLNKMLYAYVALSGQSVSSVTKSPTDNPLEAGKDVTITAATISATKGSTDVTKMELFDGTTSLGSETSGTNFTGAQGATAKATFSGLSVTRTFTAQTNGAASSWTGLTGKVTYKAEDGTDSVATCSAAGGGTWLYPFFSGLVDASKESLESADVLGGTKSVTAKGAKDLKMNMQNQKCFIAYPKAYGELSDIINPLGASEKSAFTKSEVTVTSTTPSWSATYYVYLKNSAATVDSSFHYNFKF